MIPAGDQLGHTTPGLFGPCDSLTFPPGVARGETSSSTLPVIDPDLAIASIATSVAVQRRLGSSGDELNELLRKPWTMESGLARSIEIPAASVALLRSASKRSLVVSPIKGSDGSRESHEALIAANGVDVEGLRDALGECPSRYSESWKRDDC